MRLWRACHRGPFCANTARFLRVDFECAIYDSTAAMESFNSFNFKYDAMVKGEEHSGGRC